jgi:K+-transporting ATPase c subunit
MYFRQGQHSKKQNAKQGKKSENPANTNAPPAKKEEDIDEILKEYAFYKVVAHRPPTKRVVVNLLVSSCSGLLPRIAVRPI